MEEREYHSLRAAEDRHWWFVSTQRLVVRCVRGALRGSGWRMLDAGCGTGGLVARLSTLGDVRGVDASPLAVELARSRGLDDIVCARLEDVPLDDDSLDAIVSVDVLYHRGVPDPPAAAKKLARALRPGGVMVLHLPAFEAFRGRHDDAVHTGRRFRRPELRRLLHAAGLQVEHISYRVTLLLPLILLWRRLNHGAEDSEVRIPAAPVNRVLGWIADVENRFSRLIPLPVGLSVYAVARKPGAS